MTKRLRDNDKQKTYDAENDVRTVLAMCDKRDDRRYNFYGYTMELPYERKFADIASVQNYVNKVIELDPVQEKWPGVKPPEVKHTKAVNNSFHRLGVLHFNFKKLGGAQTINEILVLHELAHHVLAHEFVAHGPEFRAAFVFLVGRAMGPEMELLLGSTFDKYVEVYKTAIT